MPDIMQMGKNPNYLGSWDLEELPGKEITLTIDKIVDEDVVANGSKERNTVCYWTDRKYKPMIMNATNKKTLVKLYKTKDTEKLKGKSVIIGIEKVKAFGDVHDALRIRPRIPTVSTAPKPKCERCGKDIEAAHGMSPDEMAAYTLKGYGQKLCSACAIEVKKEREQDNGAEQN